MTFLRKLANALFPWPGRGQREAAIREARQEKEKSVAAAQKASHLASQLESMRKKNHFAESIASQIMQGRQ